MVQGLGDLHERTYIEAQMQRILEPWRKGRKIVAGRSMCQAGSIRMESRRTFCGFWEASGKRNSMAVRKEEIEANVGVSDN